MQVMQKFLTATAIGAMLTAGIAIAMQTETAVPPKAPVTKAEMLARADARFDLLDTNKDGQLSADERKAGMDAARAAMAQRKGGEMDDFMPGTGRGGKMGARMGARMLARIDTNGDGMISKAENRAAVEMRFARMDADQNGTVEASEHRGPGMGKGKGWAKRGAGKRMRGHDGPGAAMMKADTNRDGAISKAEFDVQSAARFAKIDANGDGKLTADELRAGRPQRGAMPPPPPASPASE